ncbi:N-acetylmuramoyl-L-alanine amidase [Metabacillus fastidiosus]|uniref:N-acetylmuramoyl-L-alanine amidase n=1 Tax=Metabacillus fastidiosus TaxID=1458 RepID=UPI003D2CEC59
MKQWRFLLFVTLMLLAFNIPSKVFAQPTDTFPYIGEVNTEKTELYNSATTEGSIKLTLKKDEIVGVIGIFENNLGEEWLNVAANGVQGWVKKESISVNNELPVSMYVSKENVNVYRGAAIDYNITTVIEYGQKVAIIDYHVNKAGEIWCKIDLGNIQGWVYIEQLTNTAIKENSSNLKKTDQVIQEKEKPFSEKAVYIKKGNTKIHNGALDSNRVVYTAKENEAFKAIGEFTNKKNERWLNIELPNGVKAWVLSNEVSKEPKVNTSYYLTQYGNVRTESQNSADVLLSLSKGSAIYVVNYLTNDVNELWYQVKLEDGQLGWINAKFVTGDVVYINQTLKAGTKNTYVYWGAMNHYKKLAHIKEGTNVKVLYEFINSNNEHWYNVELSNKTKGWIPKQELFTDLSTRNFVYSIVDDSLYKDISKTSESSAKVVKGDKLLVLSASSQSLYVENTKGIRGWIAEENTTDVAPAIPNKPSVLSGKKIVLDAGHGGTDPGAVGPTKLKEKEVTLSVVKKLKEALEQEGATVILTRDRDISVSLANRVKISNASKGDIFISIHANASVKSSAKGTETFLNTKKKGTNSELLAKDIQKSLIGSLNTTDRKVKTDDTYYVLKHNKLPSVLVELAFISNPTEEEMLRSDDTRNKAAEGILEGIKDYFSRGK